eukprot:snap_masked-scaffold_26-processed-gene-4.56-mRNA-1 protein AED:1.00 eAED:1.00 QI:0/0/0/0/1/1/2/0/115
MKKVEEKKLYQLFCGPDVTHSPHYLSKYLPDTLETLLRRTKRVLKYIYDTRNLKLEAFPVKDRNKIEMYVDTSYASCEKRKSIMGFIIYMNKSIILYKCKKQKRITMISTEAEYA